MNYCVIYPQDLNSFSENCETPIYTMYTCVYVVFVLYRCTCRFTMQRCNYWFSLKMEYFE